MQNIVLLEEQDVTTFAGGDDGTNDNSDEENECSTDEDE